MFIIQSLFCTFKTYSFSENLNYNNELHPASAIVPPVNINKNNCKFVIITSGTLALTIGDR